MVLCYNHKVNSGIRINPLKGGSSIDILFEQISGSKRYREVDLRIISATSTVNTHLSYQDNPYSLLSDFSFRVQTLQSNGRGRKQQASSNKVSIQYIFPRDRYQLQLINDQ